MNNYSSHQNIANLIVVYRCIYGSHDASKYLKTDRQRTLYNYCLECKRTRHQLRHRPVDKWYTVETPDGWYAANSTFKRFFPLEAKEEQGERKRRRLTQEEEDTV